MIICYYVAATAEESAAAIAVMALAVEESVTVVVTLAVEESVAAVVAAVEVADGCGCCLL